MDSNAVTTEQEVLRWPGVTSAPGRFGAVAFRYEKRESGYIHRDRIADLPVTPEMREDLLKGGRSPIKHQEDVSAVIEILGQNYNRTKAAGSAFRR